MLFLRSLLPLSPLITILPPPLYIPSYRRIPVIITLFFLYSISLCSIFSCIIFIQSISSACYFFLFLLSLLSLPLISFLVLSYSRCILSYLSNHGFHFFIHFLAFISFFTSTWGSSRSGTFSEWVRAFFRRPTLFSFSLATFGDFGMLFISCPLPSAYDLSLTRRYLR
jgi:hypothetical protein